ncbi:MAG: hypothetical protein KKF56_00655 [Nanoarchaeota archaeon]|nr:hypothetical protein [Nanoarchaeota archaeon]
MTETKEILKQTGLTEKEAEVYLALLQLGESPATRVSQIANLNRITTYTLLKSLHEKGFCSILDKNKIQFFKPISPENILSLLEEKKNKIRTIIPELKSKQNQIQEKPETSLFEGKQGIVSMFDIILKDAEKNKEVLAYGNVSIAEKLIEYQSLHWRKTRLNKKIKIKAIIDKLPEYIKNNKELREVKINKPLSKINTYTMITENYTANLTLKGELTGILIKNKQVADKERFIFNLMW